MAIVDWLNEPEVAVSASTSLSLSAEGSKVALFTDYI